MYIIHHIFLKYLVKLSQSLFADGQVSKRLITHSIWQSMIWVQLHCIPCNGLGLTGVPGLAVFVCCTLLLTPSRSIHQSSINHACISYLAVRSWRTPVNQKVNNKEITTYAKGICRYWYVYLFSFTSHAFEILAWSTVQISPYRTIWN